MYGSKSDHERNCRRNKAERKDKEWGNYGARPAMPARVAIAEGLAEYVTSIEFDLSAPAKECTDYEVPTFEWDDLPEWEQELLRIMQDEPVVSGVPIEPVPVIWAGNNDYDDYYEDEVFPACPPVTKQTSTEHMKECPDCAWEWSCRFNPEHVGGEAWEDPRGNCWSDPAEFDPFAEDDQWNRWPGDWMPTVSYAEVADGFIIEQRTPGWSGSLDPVRTPVLTGHAYMRAWELAEDIGIEFKDLVAEIRYQAVTGGPLGKEDAIRHPFHQVALPVAARLLQPGVKHFLTDFYGRRKPIDSWRTRRAGWDRLLADEANRARG